jgi:hypothetical protein
VYPSARTGPDSSRSPLGSRESQAGDYAKPFMGPGPRNHCALRHSVESVLLISSLYETIIRPADARSVELPNRRGRRARLTAPCAKAPYQFDER